MRRNTKQRRAICAAFERAGRPLGLEEVLGEARREAAGLGIATVYRAVKELVHSGWLAAVEIPGAAPRYEQAGKGHHHHFRCTQCGKVFEIPGCGENLQRLLPEGFEITGHEVFLYGRCRLCARANG